MLPAKSDQHRVSDLVQVVSAGTMRVSANCFSLRGQHAIRRSHLDGSRRMVRGLTVYCHEFVESADGPGIDGRSFAKTASNAAQTDARESQTSSRRCYRDTCFTGTDNGSTSNATSACRFVSRRRNHAQPPVGRTRAV